MKTKFFKSVMPFLVMILAIGLSFAMDAKTSTTMGYYLDPALGVQSVPIGIECQPRTGFNCEFDGFQLYAEMELMNPLRKLNP
ncbi:DUF6520 family protein [Gelidibacter maritimus]|uniref:Secreted protein n=1 Tax=Gelidibacter maritimus TaxID=2761487 RepID=A0A7W2M644_9FLAO|nr:DUF6520 family protein [Gelidibacter maritimus]MBA6153413.1 hypothetical protein [Gelidibacter maritimus]